MQAVLPDALSIAILGAIESLLSAVVADGMTGRRHRSNCELVAQGIGNIGSALFGGICATGTIAPDNTGVNERDRSSTAKTPIDQNENQSDIDITAGIRKQVVDTQMSVDAQNVKIITQDGKVTLRGPVANADEKKRIEDIAHKVAGADKVDSQLEVK